MHSVDLTQKAFNRREFITGTTAGVFGALTLGAAATAQAQQGAAITQPEAAAGRVFYSAIAGETVQMRGHKGDMIDAYLAHPAGTGKHPGVVVIHHMPGWDEATIEVTRRFAQHGYTAICPNLQFREGKATPEANSASVSKAGGMPDDRTMGDVEGAISTARWASSATVPVDGKSTWPPARSRESMQQWPVTPVVSQREAQCLRRASP